MTEQNGEVVDRALERNFTAIRVRMGGQSLEALLDYRDDIAMVGLPPKAHVVVSEVLGLTLDAIPEIGKPPAAAPAICELEVAICNLKFLGWWEVWRCCRALRSPRAVQVNIEIMRAFVRLRQILAANAGLARKLEALEAKYDAQFKVGFQAIRELMAPPATPRRRIGFTLNSKQAAGRS